MKTTDKPLFSNSTEWGFWTERNCERCIKQSKYNPKTDDYTAFRCSIDRDIQAQAAGINEVNQRSYEAVKNDICPFLQTERKTPKRREIKGQEELKFIEP